MFLGGHGFNILIRKYFSEEWEQIYQFSLKSKTTEGNSAGIYFLKFFINQFSNQFIFLHFPGLWNLNSFTWRVVSMLFLTLRESGFNLLSSSI